MPNLPVSNGNPCPVLRAMVAGGHIPDEGESIKSLVETMGKLRGGDDASNRAFCKKVKLIALAANGLWPWDVIHNALSGVRINKLRDGPIDKHGVGSGILNARAEIVTSELDRLSSFASPKTDASGISEAGLDAAQIKTMMDANFARAAGRRRKIDRKLMDGEWPILLDVMGKSSAQVPYLSIAEVRTLFVDQKLPDRVEARLT
jgi:hypothetical protein